MLLACQVALSNYGLRVRALDWTQRGDRPAGREAPALTPLGGRNAG